MLNTATCQHKILPDRRETARHGGTAGRQAVYAESGRANIRIVHGGGVWRWQLLRSGIEDEEKEWEV
jgi:hypothetical protein